MQATVKRIGILPMGEIPDLVPKVIAAHIETVLHLPADILPAENLPEGSYNRRRLQYDAAKMIALLEARPHPADGKGLAVVSADLFVPIFSFVFGESRQGGSWALASAFRLQKQKDGSIPAAEILYERCAKVALHEIGHLYRLIHCEDPLCLMHFSGGLSDLDRTPLQFCRYCRQYLRENIQA